MRGPIKHAPTPIPIKTLETKSVLKFSDIENKIVPTIDISRKYETIFFGPFESNKYPKVSVHLQIQENMLHLVVLAHLMLN